MNQLRIILCLLMTSGLAACAMDAADRDRCGDDDHESSGSHQGDDGDDGDDPGDPGDPDGSATCDEVCARVADCGLLQDSSLSQCLDLCDQQVDQPTRDWAVDASCEDLQQAIQSMLNH